MLGATLDMSQREEGATILLVANTKKGSRKWRALRGMNVISCGEEMFRDC